jgi:transcriptional repressor NF-X1
MKCLASRARPSPEREPLKCNDECLRLQRNARLAEALKIDRDHTDKHIPYSDDTLKYFQTSSLWAEAQEREFRAFVTGDSRRLNFKPMQSAQRAFIHSLAEDYGLDSQSQDPEPHRHVSVFKTPRFVGAPRKTLREALTLQKQAAREAAVAQRAAVVAAAESEMWNALVLGEPRFALTEAEVREALADAFRSQGQLAFNIAFPQSGEEVVIRASPAPATAASVARVGTAATPAALEASLVGLKPAIARAVKDSGIAAGGVTLAHADDDTDSVRRREVEGGSVGAWSAVVAKKKASLPVVATAEVKRPASGFVALRKKTATKEEDGGKSDGEGGEKAWGL